MTKVEASPFTDIGDEFRTLAQCRRAQRARRRAQHARMTESRFPSRVPGIHPQCRLQSVAALWWTNERRITGEMFKTHPPVTQCVSLK